MTIGSALAHAADELERSGVPDSRIDAELLLGRVLGLTRTELVVERDRELAAGDLSALEALIARRRRREPLAYVLGDCGFRRLTLSVDRRVLVPRPETEIVVERCLALLAGMEEPDVLDVGTGSGAIALAIADEHPGARVTAIDTSADALAVAAANERRLGLGVRFLRLDLADGLPAGPYDLVVANPPYVSVNELPGLDPEVLEWEPSQALLDRGQTRTIILSARTVLRPGAWLVLEAHAGAAAEVARTVAANGYGPPRITKDLAGKERVVEAQWGR